MTSVQSSTVSDIIETKEEVKLTDKEVQCMDERSQEMAGDSTDSGECRDRGQHYVQPTSRRDSCGGGNSCHCRCAPVKQRRCSSSDMKPSKPSCGCKHSSKGKSDAPDKIEKINLANLVFNPNFTTRNGCVNVPILKASQNVALKNAQRNAEQLADEVVKVVNETSDWNELTRRIAADIWVKEQQPSCPKTVKPKQCQIDANSTSDSESDESDEMISCKGKHIQNQSNAARYKTELCRSYNEGGECRFGSSCTFAHGPEELRPVPRHPLYKTELCRTYHQHGYCQYGTRCHFIHDADDTDRNAPLKGCKSWGRHDKLSGALMSLASSSGILDKNSGALRGGNSADNDVLLANLRRLYALRSLNGQEKVDTSANFSATQPMTQQLLNAHQQLSNISTQHLPLSMTQPLPMDALQIGLNRANLQRVQSSGGIDSVGNEFGHWGMNPPQSPTYAGLSPFGSYQQFSPLPGHGGNQASGGYPAPYQFSATAPDLSAALNNLSPYNISPSNFSNTMAVGHLLPRNNSENYQHANYHGGPQHSNAGKSSSDNANSHNLAALQSSLWPQTSAEVPGVIDKELFGFGLDSAPQQSEYFKGSGNSYYQPFSRQYQGGDSVKYQSSQEYGKSSKYAQPPCEYRMENERFQEDFPGDREKRKYANGDSSAHMNEDFQGVRPKIVKTKHMDRRTGNELALES